MRTLLLSKKEVQALLTMKETIEAVREAYRAFNKNRFIQPPIMSIEMPAINAEIDFKAGYYEDTGVVAIKSASGWFDNASRHNLPFIFATINLFDPETGYPVCYMDGSLITYYRTGAAGAVAAACLARKDSSTVGVIGTGMQAEMQVMALAEVLPVKTVRVHGETDAFMRNYREKIEVRLPLEVVPCRTAQEAVADADIVVTATPSTKPLVRAEWIKPGAHINAIGSDAVGKQELYADVFKGAKIVNDSIAQCVARGETRNAILAGAISEEDIYGEIGEILLGMKDGRTGDAEITIFDSTGMSAQDILTASAVYDKARRLGVGTVLEDFNL